MGVDVARYGDSETVITVRWGNFVLGQWPYNKRGVDEVTGLVLRHAKDAMHGTAVPNISIKIDDSGVGGGVTDLLRAASREDKRLEIVPSAGHCHVSELAGGAAGCCTGGETTVGARTDPTGERGGEATRGVTVAVALLRATLWSGGYRRSRCPG
jgi:hypothetical protein